jgi:hypothetical protein
MLRVALCVSFVSAVTLAKAAELETTHLFGFTFGSDVNAVGEREAESEAVGRFGKSAGTYGAISEALGVKFIPFQDFSIQPIVSVARFDVSGVPGLDDRRQFAYEAASLEMRYRLFNRESSPFGLTVGFDPHWARVDDTSSGAIGGRFHAMNEDIIAMPQRTIGTMKERQPMTSFARGGMGLRTRSHRIRCVAIRAAPGESDYGVAAAIGATALVSAGSM